MPKNLDEEHQERKRHEAEIEDRAEELASDKIDEAYTAGGRRFALGMLAEIRDWLSDDESQRVAWLIERQETIEQLRSVCAEFGDNGWDDDLHLGDVIEKHLANYLRDAPPWRRT